VAHESQELLRCAADWLRLLVRGSKRGQPAQLDVCSSFLACSSGWLAAVFSATWCVCMHLLQVILLRERSVWHPTYSPLLLRRAIVHILAAGEWIA